MDHYIDGHRVGRSNVANIENEHDYQFNRMNKANHVHDENQSSQLSHQQNYYHHVHNVPGTSKISNVSHGQVLTTTNPSQAPSSGTAYVPYYHSNPPYSEESSFGLLSPEQQQRQLQHQNSKHPNQDNIHSLPAGTTGGLGGIQMDYYQNGANSIEVPPNVTLPNSSHQTHITNINENNPSGVHSLSHPMHSSSFMHHQLSSSQQNSDILNQTRLSGMQILQGQDGSSVPLDTSGMIKIKRWKIFPGRNRFFCDGRFVMAKEPAVFAFTIILLCGTFASFVYFDCHYLGSHVSWAMPICGVLLFLFVLSTLLRTTFTDPGIIPRATPEEALAFEQFSCGNPSPTYRPPPRTKEVIIRNQPVKLKYCFTCKILRPPRASHCSLCDNCVERFDHHCPWVGNCVGRRNYRYFYMFIVSLAVLTVYVFACVVTHLTLLKNETSITDAIKASPASMIVAIICFFSMWSIIGLAGFHTYLILNNLTTNEDIKGSFSSKRSNSIKNPYTGSSCENCVEILCSPLTPSLLKSRTYVYCDEKYISRRRRKSTSSSAGDSPIPPPPLRTGPYPIAPSYQGLSNSMSGFPLEHDHQNAQYILQQHQQLQQHPQQQQQINRNSHSMQNMAGSFSGPTPPMSIREQIQQHRTHSINKCPDHSSSQNRYDCSPIDSKNIQTNVYYNQNMNRLPNEYVGGLTSTVPNQVSVAYQHKNCGNVTTQNKHFST